MTELQTLTPHEHADAIDRLEAVIDHRLAALVDGYELRWANLPTSVHAWLAEMLGFAIVDLRRELLAVVHDLVKPASVH